MESYRRLLVPVIVTVLCVSLLPSVHGQAVGTQVSPFDFQLDESAVDGKRYSYLDGPGPAAIIKQNETKSLPIIILSGTDKPTSVKFHVTVGNNQTGPIQMALGVHATVEPSEITVKSNQNQTINIIVSADKNAPDGKYALNIVGEWPEKNGFVGTSIVINIGKDFGANTMPFNFQWTPLKQYQSGKDTKDIQCNQDLQLAIKSEDNSPACVKPDTSKILIERGWASSIIGISFGGQQTSANTTLPASFMPCNTPYPQSNTGVAVLYMPVNSIGKICVRYSNPNDTPEPIFGIRIFDPNNSNQNATGITTWNDLGNNYTISKGDSTVVYWINTGNQKGFYGLVLSCGGTPFGGTPFAVGYDNNSKIVSSDFPFLGVDHSCPVMLYDSHIDSLTGIGVKYIP